MPTFTQHLENRAPNFPVDEVVFDEVPMEFMTLRPVVIVQDMVVVVQKPDVRVHVPVGSDGRGSTLSSVSRSRTVE